MSDMENDHKMNMLASTLQAWMPQNKLDELIQILKPVGKHNSSKALKSVKEVIAMGEFIIPDYQRGYRWREKNIHDFLKDIDAVDLKDKNNYNCVQRIVVHKKGDRYEVIDGQQRLTTIWLIIKCLTNNEPFTLKYSNDDETKVTSYFRNRVEGTIKSWIDHKITETSSQDSDFENKFKEKLLERTKIIWDDVSQYEEKEAIDVFNRININKIDLSAADLFKAEMLKKAYNNFLERQIMMSSQWNEIEAALEDDRFWYLFSSNDISNGDSDRIEQLFRISENYIHGNVFLYITNKINKSKANADKFGTIQEIWRGVLKLFRTMRYWYDNIDLYHYVGLCFLFENNIDKIHLLRILYLRWQGYGTSLNDLYEMVKNNDDNYSDINKSSDKYTTNNFIDELKFHIRKTYLFGNNNNIEELIKQYSYNTDNAQIKKVLVLHNVFTVLARNAKVNENSMSDKLLKKNGERFPFHLFKKVEWDLEHISSRGGDNTSIYKQQQNMIQSLYEHLKNGGNTDIKNKLENWKNKFMNAKRSLPNMKDEYKEIIDMINKNETSIFKGATSEIDSIGNLVLLDYHTNRSYGNSVFQYKRKRILSADSGKHSIEDEGNIESFVMGEYCFILPCTKDVFSKCYTFSPESYTFIQWSDSDAKNYKNDIIHKIVNFL